MAKIIKPTSTSIILKNMVVIIYICDQHIKMDITVKKLTLLNSHKNKRYKFQIGISIVNKIKIFLNLFSKIIKYIIYGCMCISLITIITGKTVVNGMSIITKHKINNNRIIN